MDGEIDIERILQSLKYEEEYDQERLKKWVDVSLRLWAFNSLMPITFQGLGRIDAKLIKEDEYILKHGTSRAPAGTMNDQITLSYLWVLGAYELIRTMDQSIRNQENADAHIREVVKQVKWKFERVRVPLAKFEASRRHKDTDISVAYPSINTELGISWRVSFDTWVSRRELSDAFLDMCELLPVYKRE